MVGGTKGIGLAIARRLAEPGATVVLNYHRDDDAAREAAEAIAAAGATPHLVKADVGTRAGAAAAIDGTAAVTGHLDVLVHSAVTSNPGVLAEQDADEVVEAVNVGGLSLLHLVQSALRLLGEGSAVIFLSGVVDVVLPRHGALASAKALGECVARYLAVELAARGINVNTLRTGPVDTEQFRLVAAPGTLPPATLNGRRLTVEDIAAAAAFLASPEATMIRGQTIMIDGGLNSTVRGAMSHLPSKPA